MNHNSVPEQDQKACQEKPCWICEKNHRKCDSHTLKDITNSVRELEYRVQDLDQNRSEWEERAFRSEKEQEKLHSALLKVREVCEKEDFSGGGSNRFVNLSTEREAKLKEIERIVGEVL